MPRPDLITPTPNGLFCAAGDFFIDPWKPVERAVITHAHSDHAIRGCVSYLCSEPCEHVLRARIGAEARIETVPYSKITRIGGVEVSLHPAGHVLGSAQVRVRLTSTGETWVVTGDYKTDLDPTCQAFEPVRCDTLITESTFGLPIYVWPSPDRVFAEVNAWWRENQRAARTSIIFAYGLGKAQRLLAGVDASIGPIGVHGAIDTMNHAYRATGVALPELPRAFAPGSPDLRGCGLVVAPPSTSGTTWLRRFAAGPAEGGISSAFASGWMRVRGSRRRQSVDRGFVLSDHADWPGLLRTIEASGAARIGVTHGFTGPMVRWLTETGREAFVVPTRYVGEPGEDAGSLFPEKGDDGA